MRQTRSLTTEIAHRACTVMRRWQFVPLLLTLVVAGCGADSTDDPVAADAVVIGADGGGTTVDAGPTTDAEIVTDGGPADAESMPDADSAAADGGTETDANIATTDGGTEVDGGTLPTDLFLNPFNKLSAHHRPIGADAVAGIPGGTLSPRQANPMYDAPKAVGTRGRLAIVKQFVCGSSKQGRKYTYRVDGNDPFRTITDVPGAPANNKLPFTLKVPANAEFPSTDGDDCILLWPRNGETTDLGDVFFNFEDSVSQAKRRYEYPWGGTDTSDGSDSWDRGSSASGIRWPGTVLRGFEINAANPEPIRHALNVTATRHSGVGAPPSAHVLGKTMVWPAYSRDSGASDPTQNLGDIPYGTRVFIRWQDRDKRETLGLTARGKVLFDTFLYYGFYIIDGQGQHHDGGGVLQMRIDQEVSSAAISDVNDNLAKMLPYLYPMRNPREHNAETELHSDGLPYAGGGGPIEPCQNSASSCNTAWDALSP